MCTRNLACERVLLLPVTENETRPQGGFVIYCHRTAAAFQGQTHGTNPAAASSWEQPKVPQPSTRHTFPPVRKHLVQAQINIVAAKYVHPSFLLTPAQPFIGFCCYKPLRIHCPGWQQDKVCKNSTLSVSAQLTQDARTNL